MKTSSCSVLALLMLGAIATETHAGQVRTDGQDIILSTKGGLKLETEDKSAGFQSPTAHREAETAKAHRG